MVKHAAAQQFAFKLPVDTPRLLLQIDFPPRNDRDLALGIVNVKRIEHGQRLVAVQKPVGDLLHDFLVG